MNCAQKVSDGAVEGDGGAKRASRARHFASRGYATHGDVGVVGQSLFVRW